MKISYKKEDIQGLLNLLASLNTAQIKVGDLITMVDILRRGEEITESKESK